MLPPATPLGVLRLRFRIIYTRRQPSKLRHLKTSTTPCRGRSNVIHPRMHTRSRSTLRRYMPRHTTMRILAFLSLLLRSMRSGRAPRHMTRRIQNRAGRGPAARPLSSPPYLLPARLSVAEPTTPKTMSSSYLMPTFMLLPPIPRSRAPFAQFLMTFQLRHSTNLGNPVPPLLFATPRHPELHSRHISMLFFRSRQGETPSYAWRALCSVLQC
ncbi:hypothetical protein B0H17DRAFT_514647 [Mycena rosella]|uniref:Uncharacterized protein n=1 Tax=Mycena rosella TaxID=1033263 RepID=A0AAD7GX60_MYCRO|nr:hypothetical protein B0H17DRAFT_514647 [Mycena rosella]